MAPSHILGRIDWAAGGLAVAGATVIGSAGSAAAADSPSLTIQGRYPDLGADQLRRQQLHWQLRLLNDPLGRKSHD